MNNQTDHKFKIPTHRYAKVSPSLITSIVASVVAIAAMYCINSGLASNTSFSQIDIMAAIAIAGYFVALVAITLVSMKFGTSLLIENQ